MKYLLFVKLIVSDNVQEDESNLIVVTEIIYLPTLLKIKEKMHKFIDFGIIVSLLTNGASFLYLKYNSDEVEAIIYILWVLVNNNHLKIWNTA